MTLFNDLKVALRVLRKAPSFSLAALIVLALGIGANTAIFSVVNGVLLRPLPFAQPDRLVHLWHTPPQKSFPGLSIFSLSAANYLDWERQNNVFESSAIYNFTQRRLTGSGEPQLLRGARVEPTFFNVLGIKPMLGRAVGPGDDQGANSKIVVLTYKLWKSEFGGDPGIIGRKIELDGEAYTVVGVMPPNFIKPGWATFWTPLVWDPVERTIRGEHHFSAIARLKSGVSIEQAQADLSTISARLAQQYPEDDAGWGAKVTSMREETVGDVRKPLLILLGAVACVLLIACANVANLIMARTLDRKKEIAIRIALGATRGQVMRQVLAESVLLSTAGAALGLLVAHFSAELVVNYLGSSLPAVAQISLDARVLAFTFVIAILSGVLAGAMPGWRLSKGDPNDALKQGGRSGVAGTGKNTRNMLVVAEVALSLVLLVAAGLMVRTLWNLRSVDPGFDPSHVLTMSLGVTQSDYKTPAEEVAFVNEVLRRVRALPGVQSAGTIDDLPLQGGSSQPIQIEGRPVVAMADQPEVSVRLVSPGYFNSMQIPLVRGRTINDEDRSSSTAVVVVSESLAHRFWPNEDALGKRLTLTFYPAQPREVVGIVRDVKNTELSAKDPDAMLYWPIAQYYVPAKFGAFHGFGLTLVVRAATNPAAAAGDIKNAVHQVSASTPITDVHTMEDLVAESISPQRFNMLLLAAFAVLAVLLASVGIYSVLAYAVRRRAREIGIRMALGAGVPNILRMALGEGLRPTLLGVAIGAVAALALSRVFSSLVYGVRSTDVPTFVAVSALLVGVAIVASALPAYRASRVNPLDTLRDE
ncbi:MAG TPA: ABC transporter permease [Terriglobales bacterium]|nr:ABC transporter permease [Terriglobales bacterium]